ncbi:MULTISPECIES: hypothetical protein [Phocaeicola]
MSWNGSTTINQEYRNKLLPYIILGGKTLYPAESGVREVQEANYRKPFR